MCLFTLGWELVKPQLIVPKAGYIVIVVCECFDCDTLNSTLYFDCTESQKQSAYTSHMSTYNFTVNQQYSNGRLEGELTSSVSCLAQLEPFMSCCSHAYL